MRGEPVEIRNPASTRPWQHVLDPCVGYLMALEALLQGIEVKTLNFGPIAASLEIQTVVDESLKVFPKLRTNIIRSHSKNHSVESAALGLNPTFAETLVNWRPRWTQNEAINLTFSWWREYLNMNVNVKDLSARDILEYFSKAGES
jgi:CDP-glucose 4,6-dehydratase